jgi:N-acetylmuramoyl-L-alanine amidase
MDRPPGRDRETRELITRFRAKHARQRRLRLAAGSIAAVVIIAAVVAAVALASGGEESAAASSSTTLAMASDSSSTSIGSTETTQGPNTSETTTAHTTTVKTTATARPTTTARPPTTATTKSTATTARSTTTTAKPASASNASGKVVVIDPGHQAHGNSSLEPVGPGSSEKKAKVSSGTAGVVTGIPESELVLDVSLRLRESLKAHGIKVVMTRTTQDVDLSNIARAKIANETHADLFVRIHADGTDNSSTAGIHVLYPAGIKGWTDDIAATSKKAAEIAQNALVSATGAKDRGIDARSDMTGFNWSDVPVILPEIGFMTNPAEDKLLATSAYRDKIVKGLTQAILEFLGVK